MEPSKWSVHWLDIEHIRDGDPGSVDDSVRAALEWVQAHEPAKWNAVVMAMARLFACRGEVASREANSAIEVALDSYLKAKADYAVGSAA